MVLLKSTFAVLALALTATALPATTHSQEEPVNLAKRDPFEIVVYADGACQGSVAAEKDNLEPSGCWNFNTGGGNYGARLFNIYNVSLALNPFPVSSSTGFSFQSNPCSTVVMLFFRGRFLVTIAY